MTDLVCSMSITIGDALLKQCLLKDKPEQIFDASLSESNNELGILHQAAKILTKKGK